MQNSKAILHTLEGSNLAERGINLLWFDRIDALYHPNPANIYHESNLLSKKIACSNFYGYSSGVYILVVATMQQKKYQLIDDALSSAMEEKSYEYFYAERQ